MPFFGPEAGLNRARLVFVDMHVWSSCTERPHHCCHAPYPSCAVGERPRHFNALCLTLPHSLHLYVPSTHSLSRSPRSDTRVDAVHHGREHNSLSLLRCHLCSYSPLTEASNSVAMPYPSFARAPLLSLPPKNRLRWRVTGLDRWWCLLRLAIAAGTGLAWPGMAAASPQHGPSLAPALPYRPKSTPSRHRPPFRPSLLRGRRREGEK
jgi:hypothetical protein